MKKFFYIANVRMPTEKAHGVQIMKTCEALASVYARNADTEVVLIVPRRINNLKVDPFEYYKVKRNFKIVRVPTIDLVKFGRLGFFLESAIFSEFAVWYIRFNSKRDKIVYSRDVWPLLNCSLLGWKLFWEAHMGSESFFTKKLLSRIKGLIVISHGLKALYERHGFMGEKILVSPDAVDPAAFEVNVTKNEARKKLGLPLDKKIVMYIGLFDDWKGHITLLDAANLVSDERVKVVMIGGTKEQIAYLQPKYPHVTFLGYRPYSELAQNQIAADFLVIPNSAKKQISKYYTSPLKLFTYMASGVPVIASDLPSIREIVSENEVVFFSPDDAESLAQTITRIVDDPSVVEKAMQAKKKVAQYTWDNRAKQIIWFVTEKSK